MAAASPTPVPLPELRTRLREGKAALITHFRASRATATGARALMNGLARHVDGVLSQLWAQSGLPATAALLAVGGYGRGELYPYSDVDVLVLLAEPETEPVREAVGAFITACWDVGLEIGSSVRTVEDCVREAQADVTVQTALLESRLLTGPRKLYQALDRKSTRLNSSHSQQSRMPSSA